MITHGTMLKKTRRKVGIVVRFGDFVCKPSGTSLLALSPTIAVHDAGTAAGARQWPPKPITEHGQPKPEDDPANFEDGYVRNTETHGNRLAFTYSRSFFMEVKDF